MALKIDNEVVHATATETIMQYTDMFSTGTAGAITVSTESIMGDLQATSMLAEIASIIGRRDITAGTDASVKTLSSRDENNVKMYWGTGAIEFKMVDATRYGSNSDAFSVAIGQQVGKGIVTYLLNSALAAVRASVETQTTLVTGDGTASVTHTLLNTALRPMGDARDDIVCWVMQGATYSDLVGQAITDKIDSVAGGSIRSGSVPTLGRPTYVTDSASLDMTAGVAILGLTVGSIQVVETASRNFISEVVSGKENLVYRIQGEGEFLLNVKGYSWKTASGTNPTAATVGTAANWELKASDVKSSAGVLLNVL
jgi:hypothetical protein